MNLPLVTAIMPTRGRPEFLPAAIECFMRQTYPADLRELLILDDEPGLPDMLADFRVRYAIQYGPHLTIGAKRNLLCMMARGEIILQLDDDDWSAPERMAEQINLLLEHPEITVTGYNAVTFWDVSTRRAWVYRGSAHYALGGSLTYRLSWWRDHRFAEIQIQEDNYFVSAAHSAKRLLAVDGSGRLVARIHPRNTDSKATASPMYRPTDQIPEAFPA